MGDRMQTTAFLGCAYGMEVFKNRKIVDFGSVEAGRETTKSIKLDACYKVIDVTPVCQHLLDNVIRLDVPKALASNDGTIHLSFRPTLPNQNSAAAYYLTFEDKSKLTLMIKGRTKSTLTVLSPTRITFKSASLEPKIVHQVFLTNVSQTNDFYQWDVAGECCQVSVRPKCGEILPGVKVPVIVTIHPERQGLFYRRIFCLFKFQEPAVLEIFGNYSKTVQTVDLSRDIIFNEAMPKFRSDFCKYLSDCSKQIFPESSPLFVLSQRYIRFGRVDYGRTASSVARGFKLTNYGLKALTVTWEKDKYDVFRIEPRVTTIQSQATVNFVVSFSPSQPLQFYSCDLLASVYWGSELDFLVPECVTVSVIGQSFSTTGCEWLTPFSIDRTEIFLPATVPHVPVYTTFQIRKTGDLPILFRLFPNDASKGPEQSNFALKPLQGLITESFHIVVVQFCPDLKFDGDVIEDWVLCINSSYKIRLKICGTSQLPHVLVGDGKLVEFPLTTIGTRTELMTPIKNSTRLNLKYKLITEEAGVEEKELAPGEQSEIRLHFQPRSGPGEFKWAETVDVVWAHGDRNITNALQGQLIHARTVVRCHGRSVMPSVEGTPDMVTLCNVILGRLAYAAFRIKNNGDGAVYVELSVKPRVYSAKRAQIEIEPSRIVLQPLQTFMVNVKIFSHTIGRNNFEIVAYFFDSPTFSRKIGNFTSLTMIEVYCSFPTVHVIDINYKGIIGNLSKLALWNLLSINQLNNNFKCSHVHRNQSCHMDVPPSYQHSPPFRFQLLLQSDSAIPLTVTITPIKSCRCDIASITSITIPRCHHSREIIASLSETRLKPCEKTVLTFDVAYEEPLHGAFKFSLNICPTDEPTALKTVTILYLNRSLIPHTEPRLYLSIPLSTERFYRWSLEPVYVGDDSKYVQVLWLWNESNHDVNYAVRWNAVDSNTFQLLNPEGRIDSSCSHPLLLQCKPLEFKTYAADMEIRCLNTSSTFSVHLELNGVTHTHFDSRYALNRMPVLSRFPPRDMFVELSPQHVRLPSIPTHSYARHLFFMKNHTEDTQKFSWMNRRVWSTFSATVSPSSGFLQPEEVQSFIVEVRSYRFATKATFDVQCLVSNMTQYRTHWESVEEMQKKRSTFDASFTIRAGNRLGEEKFESPESKMKVIRKPDSFFVSLGVTIHVFHDSQLDFICPDVEKQLTLTPQTTADLTFWPTPKDSLVISSPEMPELIADVLRKAVGDLLKSPAFKLTTTQTSAQITYASTINTPPLKVNAGKRVKLQSYRVGSLMGRLIHSVLAVMFEFREPVEIKTTTPEIETLLSDKRRSSMNNVYYKKVLSDKIEQHQRPSL